MCEDSLYSIGCPSAVYPGVCEGSLYGIDHHLLSLVYVWGFIVWYRPPSALTGVCWCLLYLHDIDHHLLCLRFKSFFIVLLVFIITYINISPPPQKKQTNYLLGSLVYLRKELYLHDRNYVPSWCMWRFGRIWNTYYRNRLSGGEHVYTCVLGDIVKDVILKVVCWHGYWFTSKVCWYRYRPSIMVCATWNIPLFKGWWESRSRVNS